MAGSVEIAVWVIQAGFGQLDRIRVTAVAIARGSDPNQEGGLFGTGGPAGDGTSQAKVAKSAFDSQGWKAFKEIGSGRYLLGLPEAEVACQAAKAKVAFGQENVKESFGNALDVPGKITGKIDDALGGIPIIGDLTGLVHYITTPGAWVRVLKIAGGMMAIGIGGIILAAEFAVRPVAEFGKEAAKDVVSATAIAKARGAAMTKNP